MKQWTLRKKQTVEGPFSTRQVKKKILSGELDGTEQIAAHPGGSWKVLARVPEFYDEILNSLEGVAAEDSVSTEIATEAYIPLESTDSSKDATRAYQAPAAPLQLELEDQSEIKKRQVKKHLGRPAKVLFAVLLVLGLAFILVPTSSNFKSLLRPATVVRGAPLEPQRAHQLLVEALKNFVLDTHSGYLRSQDLLVQILEGGRPSVGAYELLCATYRELWPHVRQDSEDLKTVREVALRARKFNPISSAAQICDLSERILSGQFSRAETLAHKLLQSHPGYVFLNEMSGELQVARRDFRSAMFHYNQAKVLWEPKPVWAKILVKEAQIRMELAASDPQQWNAAHDLLEQVLRLSPQHALAMVLMGRVELERGGHHEKALNALRSSLASPEMVLPADQGEANYVMALILKSMGERSEALAAAHRAYRLYPQRRGLEELLRSLGGAVPKAAQSSVSRDLVFLGDQYMRAGNCLAAQKEYRAAFEKDPTNALAAMKAAQCMWSLHQAEEAVNWLRQALRADPDMISAYVLLADFHGQRFRQKEAFEVLQAAFRKDPQNYVVLKGFATFELKRRNFKAAEQHARRALDLYGSDTETLLILVDALLQTGNYEEALKTAALALEIEAVNPSAHIYYAKAQREIRGNRSAIDYIRKHILDLPNSYELRRALAEFLFLETRFSEAAEMVQQALSLEPKDKASYLLLAEIQVRQNFIDEARESLLSAAALDPSDAEPLFLLGQLNLERGNFNAAVSQLETVLKINPNYPLAHYALGKVSMGLDRPEEALEWARKEKRVHPGLPEPYTLAGEAHYRLKNYSDCVQEYQQAMDRSRPDALLYVRIARCFRLSGSMDAAITMLEQASYIESGNPEVYKEQGAAFEMAGDVAGARAAYEKYLQLAPGATDRNQIRSLINAL